MHAFVSRALRRRWPSFAFAVALVAVLAPAPAARAQSAGSSLSPAPVSATAAQPAPMFVVDLVDRVSGAARDPALSPADRQAKVRGLVNRGFDLPAISRFVLGRHWRTASESERAQFSAAFTDYMVALYARQMANYGGEAFTVTGQRADSDVVTVFTRVAQRDGGAPIGIDWRTVKAADGYRITDVVVEGISMMQTKRDEIGAVIARSGGGLDGMIADLRDKTGEAVTAPGPQ